MVNDSRPLVPGKGVLVGWGSIRHIYPQTLVAAFGLSSLGDHNALRCLAMGHIRLLAWTNEARGDTGDGLRVSVYVVLLF